MTRAELKAQAKAQLKGNVGKIFLCLLIMFAIGLVCGLIPGVGGIVSIIVSPPLSIGLILVYLDLSYNKATEVSRMFDGFKYTGKSIWLTILVAVFTFLWTLLLVIPGFVKMISYSMSFFILAENPEMTAREALRESKEIMDGHKMDYFVMGLSFIPWLLLVVVTCGIAAIWVSPYIQLTTTNFYHGIKKQKASPVVEETTAEI